MGARVGRAVVEFVCEGASGRLLTVQRVYEGVSVAAVLADVADFGRESGMIVHDAFLIESDSDALTGEW